MRSPAADAMSELRPASPVASLSPLFPPFALGIFIASVAGAAALVNCALVAVLIKRIKNGVCSLIAQLAVADLMVLFTTVGFELWTTNEQTWVFGRGTCIAYRGLSVFATTASIYLVATIAFHTLATINLEKNLVTRRIRNTIVSEDELRSSRHSLVTKSDSSTPPRTMNVHYRFSDKVPITPPSLFIWFLSASLSIPEFAMATTVRKDHNATLCTLTDSSHKLSIRLMLALFNFVLPTLIMTAAGVLVAYTIRSKSLRNIDFEESLSALRLSISFIIVYFIMCSPSSLLYVYRIYTTYKIDGEKNDLNEERIFLHINLIFSSLYLTSTLLRPLLCIFLLPKIKIKFFGLRNTTVDDV
ncbi:unnamed protein product [Leptosia nina]|uniref:G-protein coupled receptors family 1 profile domain-containing protein n=1 Tax=Leptosia nina TaxID=320188 RepID=A0AAV1J5H5_9NEOP